MSAEMPRATEASPPPEAEDKVPMCDGSAMGEKPCQTPPSFECTCKRCARERDASERFHACEAHQGAAGDRHRQVREVRAEWASYWPGPVAPAPPSLAEEVAAQMGVVYGPLGPSGKEIVVECHALARLLIQKNLKYGDSALNPRRVFATADAVEQLKVRIDDKINRIEKGDASIEDEDVIQDLLGYLILLRIATKRKATASAKKDP